ncbi:MAG: hypothetical protein ACFNPU_10575, partial [Corynebacterium matruchotii]|uniref:hypothetical protein n=1 Tax=Corynebacterium matruchotii TaxID=43768 RepID=UPI003617CF23
PPLYDALPVAPAPPGGICFAHLILPTLRLEPCPTAPPHRMGLSLGSTQSHPNPPPLALDTEPKPSILAARQAGLLL